MKKGEILEGIVEKIDFPNKGIVFVEGWRVVVKNALPGQKIRFAIHKKRGNQVEGRLLEILEPSTDIGTARQGLPSFRDLRRLFISKSAL